MSPRLARAILHVVLRIARSAMFAYALISDRPDPLVIAVWLIGYIALTSKADMLSYEDGFRTCQRLSYSIFGVPLPPKDDE